MSRAFRHVDIERVGPAHRETVTDWTATEEPLEVQLHGAPFSVIMRTPGADRELTAGFLLAEQVIESADDLVSIDVGDALGRDLENVSRVTLAAGREARLPQFLEHRRQVTQNSSCGLCGRRTIDSLRATAPAVIAEWTLSADVVVSLPERLHSAQMVFAQTGGLHAAGLFDRRGDLVELHEDVGRHNAVDKVLGRMLLDRKLPLSDHVLFVSGRTSFEIVQKAFLGGVPVVASVSAPSTLAIDLAEESGITLIGFVRGETFNVYTHGFRIERR